MSRRFGSDLQLDMHSPTLALDGVFSEAHTGHLTFHPAPPPGDEHVARVLASARARGGRLLAPRRLEPDDDPAAADPLAETSPVLACLVRASLWGACARRARDGARHAHGEPPGRCDSGAADQDEDVEEFLERGTVLSGDPSEIVNAWRHSAGLPAGGAPVWWPPAASGRQRRALRPSERAALPSSPGIAPGGLRGWVVNPRLQFDYRIY
ncbi:MAG: hypothetical protein HYV93_05085 [Candidatus Rokubacteria bacterium]|nr:hypothetical protein [Candidatus Rokubacteria bacterium]